MERKLAAIDVVGYSRLMEVDEAATFERLRTHRKELFEPEIAAHHGRIFKLTGDGLLAEFGSVVDAVECAVLLQREMAERNNGLADSRRIDVRMGVHVGDVIIEGDDRHGDAVNIAARLQQLAEPAGSCISGTVVDHVRHKVALRFEPRGEERLKNITEPVRVFGVALDLAPVAARQYRGTAKWSAAAAVLLLIVGVVLGYVVWPSGEPNLPPSEIETSAAPGAAHVAGSSDQTVIVPPAIPDSVGMQTGPNVAQGIPILVVLPFQDLTADKADKGGINLDMLGKGIAEEFGTDLATFPDFEVISSSSAFAYVGKSIPEIVKLTGATFVVEGSLRKSADQVMVTLQVIRGSTDRHLKIIQIEENLADPVIMQKSIAAKLRDDLGGMTGVFRHEYEKMAWDKAEKDLTEYDYYIRGHSYQLRGNTWGSMKIWQSGLARFPNSTLLHCKLFFALNYSSRKDADALVNKAATLKKRSALDEWYYHWAAAVSFSARSDHKRAVAEARAAIAMAPYDTVSHSDLSLVMKFAGDTETAIQWATFAVTHDPEPFEWFFDNLQHAYQNTSNWPEAIALAQEQIDNDPIHSKWWYDFLATAYFGTGQAEKGREASETAAKLPSPPQWTPPSL